MPNLPETTSLETSLGLISALLLLVAALYLVRSRSGTAPGLPPLHQRHGGHDGGDLFTEFVPEDTKRGLCIVASTFLHVLFVASLPILELLAPTPLLFDMNHYDVVLLKYQIPERPLTLPGDLNTSATQQPPQTESEGPEEDEDLGLPTAGPEKTQRAHGPFEGPVFEIKVGQPEPAEPPPLLEIALPLELQNLMQQDGLLPSVVQWDADRQRADTLEMIRPERFDMPGQLETALPTNPALADLGIVDSPANLQDPALAAPEGSVLPSDPLWRSSPGNGVQASGGAGAAGTALDGFGGPPQVGSGDGTQAQAAAGERGGDMSGMFLQSALERSQLGQLLAERGGAMLGGSGEPGPFRTGSADGPESGGWGKGKLTPVPRKFHGIILVSNSMSTLPEAVGVLTGNPVYTVYVDVPDAPRKWVLQFCVPQDTGKSLEISGGVVQVLSRKSLDPPYALHREPLESEQISRLSQLAQIPKRIVAYAMVDAEGNLQGARIIRGADPDTDRMVLASLRSWEFVPAFRDGEPVAVEALFGIPLY